MHAQSMIASIALFIAVATAAPATKRDATWPDMCGPKPDPSAPVQEVNCVLPTAPADPAALMAQLGLDPALCHLEANGIICVKGASPKVKRVVDFSFVPVELVSDVSVEKRGVVSDKLTVLPVPKDLLKGAVVGGVNGGLNAASDDFAYTLHVEWMPDTGMDKLNPGDVGKVGKVGNVGNVGKVGNVGAVH